MNQMCRRVWLASASMGLAMSACGNRSSESVLPGDGGVATTIDAPQDGGELDVDRVPDVGPPRCAGSYLDCQGSCIDPNVDPRNCGACGRACGLDEVCFAGKCGVACLGGTTQCGSRCVD